MAQGLVFGGLNSGGSNIKSIQRGSISLGSNTITLSIAPVDLSKTVLILTNEAAAYNKNAGANAIKGEFVDNQTLRFSTKSFINYGPIVNFFVVEFNNVKSIQRGSFIETFVRDGSIKSRDIAISSVNINKSLIFFSFKTGDGYFGYYGSYAVGAKFMSSTSLRFSVFGDSQDVDLYWQVIEFN